MAKFVEQDKYQKRQMALQNTMSSKIKTIFSDNFKDLAFIIASSSQRNANMDSNLSKQLTSNKRKLRNSLTDLIKESTQTAKNINENKWTEFNSEMEEKYKD